MSRFWSTSSDVPYATYPTKPSFQGVVDLWTIPARSKKRQKNALPSGFGGKFLPMTSSQIRLEAGNVDQKEYTPQLANLRYF
jgi:hypothetical protein